jgi:dihydrofolate reductase
LAPDYLPLKERGSSIVVTNDVNAAPLNPTVIFTKNSPGEIVSILEKRRHTEAVIIGGANVMSDFIKANLVDDIYLVVEPVLFGSGLPLINIAGFERKLHLVAVTKLNDNIVHIHYQVQK